MSRRVIDNVVALKECHGFLRGLVGFVGFRQTSVLYDRSPRAAGTSKYNQLMGSLLIGLNGVVGFSRYPLQLISLVGIVFSGLAFLVAIVYLALKISGVAFPIGNPTIVIVIAFFSGIQLLSLGVMGEYVGRIYDETRERPKYIVESTAMDSAGRSGCSSRIALSEDPAADRAVPLWLRRLKRRSVPPHGATRAAGFSVRADRRLRCSGLRRDDDRAGTRSSDSAFEAALAIGFAVALVTHFTLQRLFVWRQESSFALPLQHQLVRYLALAGFQYGVTAAITATVPSALGVDPELVYLADGRDALDIRTSSILRSRIFHPAID